MMLILALQVSSPPPPSPPPPPPAPPPQIVQAPPSYVANCTAQAENHEPFAVTLEASGAGKSRKVSVRSAEPRIVPSGKARSAGVRLYLGGRTSEFLNIGDRDSSLTLFHQWRAGAATSSFEIDHIKIGDPIVTLVRATCDISWNKP
jgi:hypothetical protein